MESIKKNTVSAKGQLEHNENITYVNPNGCGMRVMFVGNSITRHGIKEDIGWHIDCGMAASCLEHDYVHVMIEKLNQTNSDTAYCICQCADWEREYKNGEAVLQQYQEARDFEADIIIMRIIENCPWDGFDGAAFKQEYDRLILYLNKTGKAKIILTTGFWHHVGDEMIKEYAAEKKYPLVELGDLGDSDAYKAIGLFEHSGVANHPNDLGMKEIARRILAHISLNHINSIL